MAAAYNGSRARLVIAIAALEAERKCFERAATAADPNVRCLQSGPGALRARVAAQAAVARGAAGLISWGFAGALAPGLEAGSWLLPHRVQAEDGRELASDAGWLAALRGAAERSRSSSGGDLLSVDAPLSTLAQKRRAAAQTGAVGVDMESAAIFEVAHAAGVPCVVARVVVDMADDALPPDIARWVGADGGRRIAPAVVALCNPRQWSTVFMLARRFGAARDSLNALAASLVPRGFLFPYS